MVKEIVAWATAKINEEEADDLGLGLNKSISGITKFYLAQYLLKVAVDWERQNRILMFNEEVIKSLIANQVGKDEEIKRVQEKLEQMRTELIESDKKGNGKVRNRSPAGKSRLAPMKALVVRENLDNASGVGLFHKNKPLKELAPLILGSILKMLPNPEKQMSALEKKCAKVEKEKADLARKYKDVSSKYKRMLEQHEREKRKFDEKSALYEKQLEAIIRENNALICTAAENGGKVGEAIGDYVKREQYQVAKEFKEFCLRQGMDFLAEEIIALEQDNQKNTSCGMATHAERMVETKARLSAILLVNPYKAQIRRVRTGKNLVGFEEFRKEIRPSLLDGAIPKEKESEFMIIAQKAFGLIRELITMTPPCELLLPERGDVFDSDEHDVDDIVCRPEGVIKATIVPGIYTGHRILMRPVVVTEPFDDRLQTIPASRRLAVAPGVSSDTA